jgi:hypothetical protein
VHERKRALYSEIYELLSSGSVFCNLEHVASPTAKLHEEFLRGIGYTLEMEDPSNKLLDLENPAEMAARDRICRRGLSLEMAGTGAAGRSFGRSVILRTAELDPLDRKVSTTDHQSGVTALFVWLVGFCEVERTQGQFSFRFPHRISIMPGGLCDSTDSTPVNWAR